MTTHDARIAFATAVGWKQHPNGLYFFVDPFASRDVVIDAVKGMDLEDRCGFTREVMRVLHPKYQNAMPLSFLWPELQALLLATPHDLTTAFLRVKLNQPDLIIEQ